LSIFLSFFGLLSSLVLGLLLPGDASQVYSSGNKHEYGQIDRNKEVGATHEVVPTLKSQCSKTNTQIVQSHECDLICNKIAQTSRNKLFEKELGLVNIFVGFSGQGTEEEHYIVEWVETMPECGDYESTEIHGS